MAALVAACPLVFLRFSSNSRLRSHHRRPLRSRPYSIPPHRPPVAASASASAVVMGEDATGKSGYGETQPVRETKELAAELCKQFYGLGWVSGTGGSITLKVHDPDIPLSERLIVMAPSGLYRHLMGRTVD